MEIIDSIQHLELTYRIAIFGLLVAVGLYTMRDYITECVTLLPYTLGECVDTFFGIVLMASVVASMVGAIRFGVQIIFGV